MLTAQRNRPTVLLDSNVFIAAEDHGDQGHVHGPLAAELLRHIHSLGHELVLSHGTKNDVLRAPEPLRSRRQRALEKYTVLDRVPDHPPLRKYFPEPLSPNDAADLEVLTAFDTGRAQWLVTQDRQLRTRAEAAELDNVLNLQDAVDMFRALTGTSPILTVPAITRIKAYTINRDAPIFHTLKEDYPEFEEWWRSKVVPQKRDVILLGDSHAPDGLAVLKKETNRPYDLPNPSLKICTFKIEGEFQGVKRGEALLKACIEYARQSQIDCMYLEVLPEKTDLLDWLKRFGFIESGNALAPREQLVLYKHLVPPAGAVPLSPLEHAIAYGPGNLTLEKAHIVPIQDRWHHSLLPEADDQGDLFAGSQGCGNAIRKAYLCHASSRKVTPGDGLFFMRTGAGLSRITAVGVVEEVKVSDKLNELIRFVGTRTVYTRDQIAEMCASGNVLALLFRHDRVFPDPLVIKEAVSAGALNGPPQSLTEITEKGLRWIRHRLGV